MKTFFNIFQEAWNTHRTYSITDIELRERVRELTVETVIPVYKQFLETYGKMNFSSRVGKYITYDIATLIAMTNQFFNDENPNEL